MASGCYACVSLCYERRNRASASASRRHLRVSGVVLRRFGARRLGAAIMTACSSPQAATARREPGFTAPRSTVSNWGIVGWLVGGTALATLGRVGLPAQVVRRGLVLFGRRYEETFSTRLRRSAGERSRRVSHFLGRRWAGREPGLGQPRWLHPAVRLPPERDVRPQQPVRPRRLLDLGWLRLRIHLCSQSAHQHGELRARGLRRLGRLRRLGSQRQQQRLGLLR